jgi:hypothetical protein
MKLDGFKLHSIYLDRGGESFDLHNCYDFIGFDYDISSRTLRLRWTPSTYAPPGERRPITVTFQQVTHFSAQPRDRQIPFTQDDCLSDVCFVLPDAHTDECFSTESTPTSDLHYVFSFMSGFAIRVHAESAVCQIQ